VLDCGAELREVVVEDVLDELDGGYEDVVIVAVLGIMVLVVAELVTEWDRAAYAPTTPIIIMITTTKAAIVLETAPRE